MSTSGTYDQFDVVVVGHGISGLATALSAHEHGVSPVILEKSPRNDRGGHSRFAGGLFRFPMEDPERIQREFNLDERPPRYTRDDFYRDLMDVSGGRATPELAETFVSRAHDAVRWLCDHGVTWHVVDRSEEPGFGTTVGTLQADGEGKAVVETLAARVEQLGITVHYETECRALRTDDRNRVRGVLARGPDGPVEYRSRAVVMAAGSYVSSPEKRARYFGREGDAYVVRGSSYNTGEALDAALEAGAMPAGQWGGAHQVMLDARAPDAEGGRTRINGYQYGLILNERGERFLDEGEDYLLKTYAKFGKKVYDQPGQQAFVIFDSQVEDLVVSQMDLEPIRAPGLDDLLNQLDIEDVGRARRVIMEYNDATTDHPFDPEVLDGKTTRGLSPDKSNWALPLTEPPFSCFPVRPGVTFGFGGLQVNPEGEVKDTRKQVIPGLWAVGNSTANFFYDNYPGGSALSRGTTFGRRVGRNAAEYVRSGEEESRAGVRTEEPVSGDRPS